MHVQLPADRQVTVGVDTHADQHVGAALDPLGRLLGTQAVPSTAAGAAALLAWARRFGAVERVGIEGTGSYGAGLSRWLRARGVVVVEVARPKRPARRGRGKSDPVDAEAAARAVQAGTATARPKAGTGPIESIRALQAARRSALKEVAALDAHLGRLVAAAAPDLVALKGVGTDTAATLLVTAGDNPDRLRSEASFAHLCGVAPIPASSGKTVRHRLNRGGDRQANRALHLLAVRRLRWDPATVAYAARRRAEGLSKPEILRCLKRYIARQLYPLLAGHAALGPATLGQGGPRSGPPATPLSGGAAVTRQGRSVAEDPAAGGVDGRRGRSHRVPTPPAPAPRPPIHHP